MFEETAALLGKTKIIPVVTLADEESSLCVAKALCDGGIKAIEVTFRTEEGEEGYKKIASCIKKIRQEIPEMLLGAGTVINPELAELAW